MHRSLAKVNFADYDRCAFRVSIIKRLSYCESARSSLQKKLSGHVIRHLDNGQRFPAGLPMGGDSGNAFANNTKAILIS